MCYLIKARSPYTGRTWVVAHANSSVEALEILTDHKQRFIDDEVWKEKDQHAKGVDDHGTDKTDDH